MNERQITFNATFQYRLATFNVLTNVVNVQRLSLLLIAISDDEYCLERDVT
jgi:hypothetical protein